MPTARKRTETRRVLPEGLPFIPYIRVSDLDGRNHEAEDYGTETIQLASITATAGTHALPLMEEPFIDRDISGSNFDRPAWQRALALIEDGKAAGIIARNQARMSRARMGETLAMVAEVEQLGGRLYDETGPVEGEGIGEIVTALKAWQARSEWEQRRADRMKAVEGAIGRGVHLQAPYGYVKGPDKRLVIEPVEARVVRRMFELRADGRSWPAIAQTLNEAGVMPRPYTRDKVVQQARWTGKTVRQIVLNRVYTGVAYNGDHETAGAHKEIVSPELFGLATRTRGTKPLGPDEGYLLTGLVRCHSCGYAMTYAAERGRQYLRCRPAQHGVGCANQASVPAADLETWVVECFTATYLTGDLAPVVADGAVAAAAATVEEAKRRLTVAYRMRRDLPADAPAMERDIAEADVEEARAAAAVAERALLQERMAEHGADLPPELDAHVFATSTIPKQRQFLSAVYAAVVVRAGQRWREPASERAALLVVQRPRLVGANLRAQVTSVAM